MARCRCFTSLSLLGLLLAAPPRAGADGKTVDQLPAISTVATNDNVVISTAAGATRLLPVGNLPASSSGLPAQSTNNYGLGLTVDSAGSVVAAPGYEARTINEFALPNWMAAVSTRTNSAIRIIGMGDSTFDYAHGSLFYGFANTLGQWWPNNQCRLIDWWVSASVGIASDDTNWFSYYLNLPAGAAMTNASRGFDLNGPLFIPDTLRFGLIAFPHGGPVNLGYCNPDGSGYVQLGSMSLSNSAGVLGKTTNYAINVTQKVMPVVTCVNADVGYSNMVVYALAEQNNRRNLIFYELSAPGKQVAHWANVSTNVFYPLIGNLAPDLIAVHQKNSPGYMLATNLPIIGSMFTNAAPNADLMFVSTFPAINTAAWDIPGINREERKYCAAAGLFFCDTYGQLPSTNLMYSQGYYLDDVHLSKKGGTVVGGIVARDLLRCAPALDKNFYQKLGSVEASNVVVTSAFVVTNAPVTIYDGGQGPTAGSFLTASDASGHQFINLFRDTNNQLDFSAWAGIVLHPQQSGSVSNTAALNNAGVINAYGGVNFLNASSTAFTIKPPNLADAYIRIGNRGGTSIGSDWFFGASENTAIEPGWAADMVMAPLTQSGAYVLDGNHFGAIWTTNGSYYVRKDMNVGGSLVVSNDLAVKGVITGSGAGLTNLPASSITGTLTGSQIGPAIYPAGLLAYWDAGTLMANTNGAMIVGWPDSVGGSVLGCTNATYSADGVAGRPGVYFGAAFAGATNNGFFTRAAYLNTNVTLAIVYRNLNNTEKARSGMLLTAGSPTNLVNFLINADDNSPGSVALQGPHLNTECFTAGVREVNVLTIRYDGIYVDAWLNERSAFMGRVGNAQNLPANQVGGLGLVNNLNVGNYADFRNLPDYLVAKILVYSNALSYAAVAALNRSLTTEYAQRGNNCHLVGDSITQNNQGTNGTAFITMLAKAMPGWQFSQTAGNGNQTWQMLTNMAAAGGWLNTARPEAEYNIAHLYAGVNDQALSYTVAQVATNTLNFAAFCHSNNWYFIDSTLVSAYAIDLSGFRTNLNNWKVANWTNYADGLANYGGIPELGTNFACSNTVNFAADMTHPKAPGYLLMSNTLFSTVKFVRQK